MTFGGHWCSNWQCFNVVSAAVSSAKITPKRCYNSQTAMLSACPTNGSPSRSAEADFRPERTWMPPPHKGGALQTPESSSSPPQVLLRSGHRASRLRYRPKYQLGPRLVIFHGLQVHTAWLGLLLPMRRVAHGVFARCPCRPRCQYSAQTLVSGRALPGRVSPTQAIDR